MILHIPRIVLLLAVVAMVLVTAGGVWWAFRPEPYEFKGGYWTPPREAPTLALTDQRSQPFDLLAYRGNVVLVFFGYTHCPDYCPTTLLEIQQIKHELGGDAERIDTVFVSVDPERDSPARLSEYLAFFDPTATGLTGTIDETNAVKQAWGVLGEAEEQVDHNGYLVSHSTSLHAIDPEGNLRLIWAYGTPTEDIVSDIQHVLAE